MVQAHTYKVLLFGSGMMTPPLIDYLCKYGDTHITVASNIIEDAQKLCQRHPQHMAALLIDVFDPAQVEAAIRGKSLVISFIPPPLHPKVLPIAVRLGVNVTTSSYISPLMLELDAEAKRNGSIVLNECGLDPGLDILGTMKVVHEAQAAGHKVVSYESYCGGIPVAEQADNPLGYKFSWNPGASIKASRNTAIFMKNGERVVTNEPMKHTVDCDDVSVAMKLEAYPNRDSTVFQERFGMQDCHTFIRGTYRFQGFASIISSFHDVGLTSDDIVDEGVRTLKDLCLWRFSKVNAQTLSGVPRQVCDQLTEGMSHSDRGLVEGMISRTDFKHHGANSAKVESACRSIVKTMHFLKFFDAATIVQVKAQGKGRSALDVLSDILGPALKHTDIDRDLVVMRHVFWMEDQQKKQWRHTSTMIKSGHSHASGGFSFMSTSVGVTCGIASRMVLEGRVPQRGVLSPIYPEIYNPILKELEKFDIRMIEESERPGGLATASNRPKL